MSAGDDARRVSRAGGCLIAALALIAPANRAHAQGVSTPPTAIPQTEAEALFMEGRQRMESGDYPAACSRFADSQKLDPAPGTLLNLADCYEKNGQLASAWATFREAATAAASGGRLDWSELAAARARILEPSLPTLTVVVEDAAARAGVEVLRDGVPFPRSMWGTPMPVDPAVVVVEARATGAKPWKASLVIDAAHPKALVHVPALEAIPPPSPPSSATLPPASAPPPPALPTMSKASGESARPASLRRPLGWTALGTGVASVGLGAVLGALAMNRNDEAARLCPKGPACADGHAVDLTHDAWNLATGSTVSFVAGGAFLLLGSYLWLTAPSSSGPAVRPSVIVGNGAAGAFLQGRF